VWAAGGKEEEKACKGDKTDWENLGIHAFKFGLAVRGPPIKRTGRPGGGTEIVPGRKNINSCKS